KILHQSAGRLSPTDASGGSLRILDLYGLELFLPAAEWCDAAAGLSRTPTDMGKPRLRAVRRAARHHGEGAELSGRGEAQRRPFDEPCPPRDGPRLGNEEGVREGYGAREDDQRHGRRDRQ